jgi:hypothetical protein
MTRGVGRPRTKQRSHVERVVRIAAHLAADPNLTANQIYRREGGRRRDVLTIVAAIRAAMTAAVTAAPSTRFPNSESGISDGAGDPQ